MLESIEFLTQKGKTLLFPHNNRRFIAAILLITLALVACTSKNSLDQGKQDVTPSPGEPDWFSVTMTDVPTGQPFTMSEFADWFSVTMTDMRTGQPFTMSEFAGKVVLLETMAQWCPTCELQEIEVKKLHELLGNPEDLVSISLDVDLHEDEASLKRYAERLGYDWILAVAPLEVARALGNLYSAQYLNPPASPMLIIDKNGNVFGLPLRLKSAESLKNTLEPYLDAIPEDK